MDSKTFVSKLAIELGRSVEDVESSVKALTALMAETIVEGNTLTITGFGAFEPRMKMERVTVHPSSGKKLLVPPKLTVAFKPSAILKQKVRK